MQLLAFYSRGLFASISILNDIHHLSLNYQWIAELELTLSMWAYTKPHYMQYSYTPWFLFQEIPLEP